MNEQQVNNDYGYQTDEVDQSRLSFGLNQGVRLIKMEWIPNGGKDGAEQEALDIVFLINGKEKSYRKFPVTQAYDKDNQVVTDPTHEAMIDAKKDLSAVVVHILHAFVEDAVVRQGLSRKIDSFKDYCRIVAGILPANYKDKELDIFLQWGWNLGDKKQTYLEIPTKMKSGKWLSPSQGEGWKEIKVAEPLTSTTNALYYTKEIDGKPVKHPFIRNGWFMLSNFAKQQKQEGAGDEASSSLGTTENAGTEQAAPQPAKPASAW